MNTRKHRQIEYKRTKQPTHARNRPDERVLELRAGAQTLQRAVHVAGVAQVDQARAGCSRNQRNLLFVCTNKSVSKNENVRNARKRSEILQNTA